MVTYGSLRNRRLFLCSQFTPKFALAQQVVYLLKRGNVENIQVGEMWWNMVKYDEILKDMMKYDEILEDMLIYGELWWNIRRYADLWWTMMKY